MRAELTYQSTKSLPSSEPPDFYWMCFNLVSRWRNWSSGSNPQIPNDYIQCRTGHFPRELAF